MDPRRFTRGNLPKQIWVLPAGTCAILKRGGKDRGSKPEVKCLKGYFSVLCLCALQESWRDKTSTDKIVFLTD